MKCASELASRLGIFARTFRRDTPAQVAAAVAAAGYALAHWNFAAIGLPTLAGGVTDEQFTQVRVAFHAAGPASSAPTSSRCAPARAIRTTCGGPTLATAPRPHGRTCAAPLTRFWRPPARPVSVWAWNPKLARLGGRIVGVQAKDVVAAGYSAAGTGRLDYPAVFAQLARIAPVPVVVQDATEDDAAGVRADLLRWHAEATTR